MPDGTADYATRQAEMCSHHMTALVIWFVVLQTLAVIVLNKKTEF